jgi:hypothetical protein
MEETRVEQSKGGIEREMLVSLWDESPSRDCHTRHSLEI